MKILKFFIILTIIGCILLFADHLYQSPIQNINDSEAQTITLPSEISEYLGNSIIYGNAFNEGQKFVVYFTDPNPKNYPENFLSTLSYIKDKKNEKGQYAFLPRLHAMEFNTPQEKLNDAEFLKLCHQFCIINPKTNEIFYISGITKQDAEELPKIFNALHQW